MLIDQAEASEIVAQAKRDFPLGNELKGSQMLSNGPGRRAAEFIFEKVGDRSRVVVADKRFALAGKLYEYIFDPVVAGHSSSLRGRIPFVLDQSPVLAVHQPKSLGD